MAIQLNGNWTGERDSAIDQFRGLAIFLMVLANFLAGVRWIPAWLKHAPDIGLTVIDIIAPMFIFAIGLTFYPSFQRRFIQNGTKPTYLHFIRRFLSILGIGAILSAGERAFGISTQPADWGVLQAIGIAGLVTLIFIRMPLKWRAIIGIIVIAGYQIVLDRFWLGQVLGSPHGGIAGSISWSGMLILSTCLAEIYHNVERRKVFPWLAVMLLAAGLIMALWLPVSKNRVSSSYIMISMAISAIMFWILHLVSRKNINNNNVLTTWGRNPLVLYVLHLLLIGIVFLPGIPAIYEDAPIWLIGVETVILIFSMTMIAKFLEKKDWILTL